jgi:hypothetical protein
MLDEGTASTLDTMMMLIDNDMESDDTMAA